MKILSAMFNVFSVLGIVYTGTFGIAYITNIKIPIQGTEVPIREKVNRVVEDISVKTLGDALCSTDFCYSRARYERLYAETLNILKSPEFLTIHNPTIETENEYGTHLDYWPLYGNPWYDQCYVHYEPLIDENEQIVDSDSEGIRWMDHHSEELECTIEKLNQELGKGQNGN